MKTLNTSGKRKKPTAHNGGVRRATKKYKEENQEILFAIEAMRRSRLALTSRLRQTWKPRPYLIIMD